MFTVESKQQNETKGFLLEELNWYTILTLFIHIALFLIEIHINWKDEGRKEWYGQTRIPALRKH